MRDIAPWSKPSCPAPETRYARGFTRCIVVGAGFGCIALVAGLSSGILH